MYSSSQMNLMKSSPFQILTFHDNEQVSKEDEELLSQRRWLWSQENAFNMSNILNLMPKIVFVNIVEIDLKHYSETLELSNILTFFTHSHFPSLKILNLSFNRIKSIEDLRRLKAPNLQNLELEGNQIRSIQALSRCSFNFLENINLNCNLIVCWKPLSDFYFPKLKSINIGSELKIFQMNQRWFNTFKSQPPRLLTNFRAEEVKSELLKSNFSGQLYAVQKDKQTSRLDYLELMKKGKSTVQFSDMAAGSLKRTSSRATHYSEDYSE